MMTTGRRTRRYALIAGQLLALILLVASNRSLFAPTEVVHKSQDSKRPKTPKNIVRAEPVGVTAADKQDPAPSLARLDAGALDREIGNSRLQALPRKAFAQLTSPDYLKNGSPGNPHIPLSPPV